LSQYTLTPCHPNPTFKAREFLQTAQSGELPGTELSALEQLWPRTLNALHAWRIDAGPQGSWLLLWLDETLERAVEERFEHSPAQGFLEHALAVHCVMAAAANLVPELASHGCAPVPEPHPAVGWAVNELGLSWPERDTLCRRYSLLTRMPFAGGCEDCTLAHNCPRHKTTTAP